MIGDVLSLLSIAPMIKKAINEKTIQGNVVEIIDKLAANNYPYFKSKILIDFCSIPEVISLLQKTSKGNDVEKELSEKLEEFLEKKKISVKEPFTMFKVFLQEMENEIIKTSSASEKLIHKNLRKIEENQFSKDDGKTMGEKLDKVYELIKSINPKIVQAQPNDKNLYFKEFLLKWPNTWRQLSEKELEKTNQLVKGWMEQNSLGKFDPNSTKLGIGRIDEKLRLNPVINVGIRNVTFQNVNQMFEACVKTYTANNYEIYNYHIHNEEQSFTINYKLPKEFFPNVPMADRLHQFQKYVLSNGREYVLTLTKISEKMLIEFPELEEEFTTILQSFAIV